MNTSFTGGVEFEFVREFKRGRGDADVENDLDDLAKFGVFAFANLETNSLRLISRRANNRRAAETSSRLAGFG